MHVEDVDTSIKVITVGNGAVGKTSLIRGFCENVFDGEYRKTLGVDFVEKRDFEVAGLDDPVTLNIWDTAGQEEYDGITANYYREAQGCILCFASDDLKSLNDLGKWKNKVEQQCGSIPMIIAQTKVDLMNDSTKTIIPKEACEEKAKELNLKLFRTSVKDNTNVREVFEGTVVLWDKYQKENRNQCAETKTEKKKEKNETLSGKALGDDQHAGKKRAKKGGCC